MIVIIINGGCNNAQADFSGVKAFALKPFLAYGFYSFVRRLYAA